MITKKQLHEAIKSIIVEIWVNKPNRRKLKVKARDDGYVYFKFYLDNNESEETNMLLTNFSLDKNYAEVYLNEDDIYADRLHEDVIYYLNSNRIPFTVYDDDEEDYIDGKNFEIPDHPDDMLGKYILINKKDCDVPREYQREFDNL